MRQAGRIGSSVEACQRREERQGGGNSGECE